MIKYKKPQREYTLDEMMIFMKNPRGKRSLAELDTVIDEIIERNPEWVEELNEITNQKMKRTCNNVIVK